MIFLTVGTSFPFDRLVRGVDDSIENGLVQEEVFAQVGVQGYKPKHMPYVELLSREQYDDYVKESSAVISHAGIGAILSALDCDKPLLVMPRRKCYKELVNDHQLLTAKRFEELGHIIVAYNDTDLPEKISELNDFVPAKRNTQVDSVVNRICQFLAELRT